MANVDGTYDVTVKSPLGEQKMTLTVNSSGAGWTGSAAGGMGSMDIADGQIDGDTLKWTMNMTVPMPMKLDCTATVDGDSISGQVGVGAFGSFPLNGTKQA